MICACFGCAPAGSGSTTTSEPDTEPNASRLPTTRADIRGTITNIQTVSHQTNGRGEAEPDPEAPVASDNKREVSSQSSDNAGSSRYGIGVVLIEENPAEEYGSQKDSVSITKSTKLLKQEREELVSVGFDDLKVGHRAKAWYTGPVAESYPRQATASVVVIGSR